MPPLCITPEFDRLDAEDLARLLIGFRGQPVADTPITGSTRRATSGTSSAYVVDPDSGLAYLLD